MASGAPYTDADAQMAGGSGLYGNQNGGTPPPQQQHHMAGPESDLQLQDNLAALARSTDMMTAQGPQAHHMGTSLHPAHHQFQTPTRPNHSPQQMAQTVMSLEDHNMYSDHDGSRKRSKVSRACDECRRKKIRCDATSENGPEACSSCKRTGARCQFSRQPMKRGPSKGYIKELADRLNSLESQIQNPHAPSPSFDYAVGEQALGEAQTPTQFNRKRTHSMSEGLQDAYNRSSWPAQDRGIEAWDPQVLASLTSQDLMSNGQSVRRPSYGDLTLAGNLITGTNDGAIKAYYNTIHAVLPVLSPESASLNRLTNCPAKLRESFFLALECCVRSYSSASLPPAEVGLTQLTQKCLEATELAQHTLNDSDSTRQFFNHIVYCQVLEFLIIASDRPPTSAIGSTGELLGRLAGRISDLGLNDRNVIAGLREQDREIFEDSRRLFWVAVILDRFHASSRSKDMVLPLHCGSLSRDDLAALGEVGYHLARAADIVGQITYITRAGSVPNIDPSSPFAFVAATSTSPTSLYLNGQLSRYRESLDISNLSANSPPHLAYLYLCIVAARMSTFTGPKEILVHTQDLLSSLQATNTPISPLHHIFASLVATSLSELSDRIETQVDAHASMREMSDSISNGRILHRVPNGSGWDTAIRNILHQTKAQSPTPNGADQTSPATQPNMAGLQHLAAAAVGEREGADVRPASSGGGNGTTSRSAQDISHDVSAAMAAATEAAAAQATAAAAQQQLQNASGSTNASNSSNGGNQYDPSALVKEGGFMAALT